ncbi:MAG: YicC/YloC family endoribonuclease [Acutalibacteraceae bacterium]
MVRSMTGFGRSEQKVDGREITVEIKSVNHRYFEFGCRVSRGYAFLEEKLKAHIQKAVARGKIDVYVSVTDCDEKQAEVTVNHSLAAGYVAALKELKDTYALSGEISVSDITRFNDIFTVHRTPEDEDAVWASVRTVLDSALESFIAMREQEGIKMKEDILLRSKSILSLVSSVEEKSPETVSKYRQKLEERLKEVLGGVNIDEQRLLTEAAIFADKVAVAEETVRLRSHFDQMFQMLESGEAIGRKLDFILQEMNRETNTIGSKVQDAELAHIVVEIKGELEKIREQLQNIE